VKKRIVGVAVLAVLLAASTYAQTTDFFELAASGTSQQVQAAIMAGADLKARDGGRVLEYAGKLDYEPDTITSFVGEDNDDATPLMEADAHNQDPEVITLLLNAGVEIEAKDVAGRTSLMYAAAGNENPEVIAILLKAGADLNAQTMDQAKWNGPVGGMTALMLAAAYNKKPK